MQEINLRSALESSGTGDCRGGGGRGCRRGGPQERRKWFGSDRRGGQRIISFSGGAAGGRADCAARSRPLVSLQVLSSNRDELTRLFKTLTNRTQTLMGGQVGAAQTEDERFPPQNTGEMGYDALKEGHLSIMTGVGSSLFVDEGKDRFGLASRKPIALKPMPGDLAGDSLNPALLHGDLFLQFSSDHPLHNMFALRDILRNTKGQLSPMWVQPGFQRFVEATPGGG